MTDEKIIEDFLFGGEGIVAFYRKDENSIVKGHLVIDGDGTIKFVPVDGWDKA